MDAGKLVQRQRHPKRQRLIVLPAFATACKNSPNSDLIFLPDSLSRKVFLADSGASLSIVPYNSQTRPFGPKLRSASGASISAWGFKTLQVKFGKTRFSHRFLLAEVANPILGMDFFKKFDLLISPHPHPQGALCIFPGLHPGCGSSTGPPPARTLVSTPEGPPSPACQPSV